MSLVTVRVETQSITTRVYEIKIPADELSDDPTTWALNNFDPSDAEQLIDLSEDDEEVRTGWVVR